MEFGVFTAVVGVIGALTGMYFNSNNNRRNNEKEVREQAREQGAIMAKLDAILMTMDKSNREIADNKSEISQAKLKQVVIDERVDSLTNRVIILEKKSSL